MLPNKTGIEYLTRYINYIGAIRIEEKEKECKQKKEKKEKYDNLNMQQQQKARESAYKATTPILKAQIASVFIPITTNLDLKYARSALH